MRSDAAPLRSVFFGTSPFAVPSLDAIADSQDVIAVVTQPDRPAGRGLTLTPSAVKRRALERSIKVWEPERIDDAFVDRVAALRPQLLVCAAYGKILPRRLLAIDGMTALNVHPSMLPEYRGATPIQAALRDGRTSTGVTVIWMSERMDAGDIALQQPETIHAEDTYGTLHDRLAAAGARLIDRAAALLSAGQLPRVAQDESRATYTRTIAKDDLRIDVTVPAAAIVNLVRSASPSPGAWIMWGDKRLKVLEARAEPQDAPQISTDGPALQARDGLVRLLKVVPEGRRAMTGADFAALNAKRS